MRKTLTALAAVGLVAAAMTASTTDASARNRGWVAPAIIGGVAAGALLGGALAGPRYYYGEPAYAAPPTCWARERVWVDGRGWRWRRVPVPCY